jgi:NAD(P)-dependent dehydrogenase (short-subunit alcohol dehydrogenase family)
MGERVAVVTGGNRGIGLEVARQLAARGLRVVAVARDAPQARAALGQAAEVVEGDLGCLRSTRHLARDLLERCPRIDLLIHNAGLWPSRLERNEDGLERAFMVNHLAPFALNHLLHERLSAARARVVTVSAGLYAKGRVDLARTPAGDDFHPLRTYATTKLCNLLTLASFAERWKHDGVTVHALHPGVIRTGLGDRDGALGLVLRAVKRLWKTPREGARPVVAVALEEGLRSGSYHHLEAETPLLPVARDTALAKRVWDQAMSLIGAPSRA